MDKGAHFYKCDFQVHSPRDINWNGDRPLSSDERKSYAEEFIKKCRDLGLQAVAITDHHDFAFYPIIKNAANEELDDEGNPIPDDQKIIVYPGLELTLSQPSCQALLIIDADYPVDNLDQILHLLAITPTTIDDSTTVLTTAISNSIVKGFEGLYEVLNSVAGLKGKFIVLPNISERGAHTLLRTGNSEYYRKMPCVGGYVDGSISQHGTGNKNIVNGIAREYGYKSIAVFQTSDNRQRDFGELGRFTTWVKWAVPTAEALRQACLAKQSRLSHDFPELPQIFITNLDVTNSKFLASFTIDFNQQYNALIGGRGTGKSTILEYIRWGLCDIPNLNVQDEQSEIEKRSQSLIEKTLVPFDGEVRITFVLNNIVHIIKRNSKSKATLLKIGSSDFESVKEEEIRRILPIQAYSQKQLSSVGVKTEELKRFIEQPIANDLNNLKFRLLDNSKQIRGSYNNVLRKSEIQKEIDQFKLEIKSLNVQVESLRRTLRGISDQDQLIIAQKQKYDREQNQINRSGSELTIITSKITDLIITLDRYPEPFVIDEQIENQELIKSIEETKINKIKEIKKLAKELQETLNEENLKEYNELVSKWNGIKTDFEIQYEATKAKTSSNQAQLEEIERIEKRLKELSVTLNERNSVIKELGNPEEDFNQFTLEWFTLHQNKVDLLNEQAQIFSKLSNGLIKAEVTKSIDIRTIKKQLLTALQGTRINELKIDSICKNIVEDDNPLENWKNILKELKSLAELKGQEGTSIELPETPFLNRSDLNDVNRARIVEVFTPEIWLNLATTELEFNPEFRYTTNSQMGDQIPFADASAGQQATALLTVLLNQKGSPLIIDQPEDDIDNRAIDDIIKCIWDAKKHRQLIFTSHNANLVVNGDAELVICCDYRDTGSQTRGRIKAEGAIDFKAIRDEITWVMEGGEKAFKLRKDKYGF